jgi:hypothetical protein
VKPSGDHVYLCSHWCYPNTATARANDTCLSSPCSLYSTYCNSTSTETYCGDCRSGYRNVTLTVIGGDDCANIPIASNLAEAVHGNAQTFIASVQEVNAAIATTNVTTADSVNIANFITAAATVPDNAWQLCTPFMFIHVHCYLYFLSSFISFNSKLSIFLNLPAVLSKQLQRDADVPIRATCGFIHVSAGWHARRCPHRQHHHRHCVIPWSAVSAS